MTMILAEMNNIITQMAPPGNKGVGRPNQGQGKDGLKGFAGRLENEVRKLDDAEARSRVSVDHPRAEDRGAVQGKTGLKFLSELEQVLLKISGGNLGNVTVSREGLDSLEQLLIMAGFDPDEISGIIAGLKEKAGEGGVDLEAVMDSLAPMETLPEEGAAETDLFLDASALPFMTALMERFGLPKAAAESVVEKADKGQQGISLNIVVEELKTILEGSPRAMLTSPVQDRAGVSKMLGQLNMAFPEKAAGETVTLKDLLAAFDAHIKARSGAAEGLGTVEPVAGVAGKGAKASAAKLMGSFLEGLTPRSSGDPQPVISFSQVRDQFKNEMAHPGKNETIDPGKSETIYPGKSEKGKTGMLPQNKPAAQPSPDTNLKNFEPVMSKPASGGSAEHGGLKADIRDQGKADLLKQADVPQGDVGPGKNDIGENRLKGLAAKPAERALPSYVTHQVNRSIVRAVNQGDTTLTLQLKPAALGRLSLTIDNAGNSIKVSILTENQAAKDMLASNVNELKTALGTSGISLDSFDVDMSSDFRQSMADAGNQARNFNRKNNGNGRAFSGSPDPEAEEGLAGMTPSGMHVDGSYHFVA